jgi:hypothetical protein
VANAASLGHSPCWQTDIALGNLCRWAAGIGGAEVLGGETVSEDGLIFIGALFFLTVITLILMEIQKTLRSIRLGMEKHAAILTAANEKLEELAAKLDSVNENIFDISERFDAPGIAKRKTDKRARGMKALLDKLALEATRPHQGPNA